MQLKIPARISLLFPQACRPKPRFRSTSKNNAPPCNVPNPGRCQQPGGLSSQGTMLAICETARENDTLLANMHSVPSLVWTGLRARRGRCRGQRAGGAKSGSGWEPLWSTVPKLLREHSAAMSTAAVMTTRLPRTKDFALTGPRDPKIPRDPSRALLYLICGPPMCRTQERKIAVTGSGATSRGC